MTVKNEDASLVGSNRVFYVTKPNQKSINTMKQRKKICSHLELQITNYKLLIKNCKVMITA